MTEVHATITDVVPATLYGFAVNVRIGPYPMDAQRTHRRAVYAVLTPADPGVARSMRSAGKRHIMSCSPLTAGAVAQIQSGDEDFKEYVAKQALALAAGPARRVWEASR